MTLQVVHTKVLVAPDSGSEDKVYGVDYVSLASHAITGGDSLALVTGANADTTMAANSCYVADMTAWVTADRSYTLPTNAVVGDRIAVQILAGNASFELILKTGAGQTCAFSGVTVAAATEITRLFITGESMVFRYVATNKWAVEYDGRIAQVGLLRLSTDATAEVGATNTQPTAKGGVWTADVDNASITVAASDRINARRAGNYCVMFSGSSVASVTAGTYYTLIVFKNGVTTLLSFETVYMGGTDLCTIRGRTVEPVPLATDDFLVYAFASNSGSRGLKSNVAPTLRTAFGLTEILP